MTLLVEHGWPKPIMNITSAEAEKTGNELREVLDNRLPSVIKLYADILKGDSPHIARKEIARISEEELQRHLAELALLEKILKEFAGFPSGFEIRTSGISKDELSYRVRLRPPSSSLIGETPETSQTQLSFYARVIETGETRDRIITIESLKGIPPDQALRNAERQFYGGRIMITTLGIMRGKGGNFLVIPRAGIELIKEGDYVDLNGLKPVGSHFHRLTVPNEDEISLQDYLLLHNRIASMSGSKPA